MQKGKKRENLPRHLFTFIRSMLDEDGRYRAGEIKQEPGQAKGSHPLSLDIKEEEGDVGFG